MPMPMAALGFRAPPLFLHANLDAPAADEPDMSFLQDVHLEVTDALLAFGYDPLDPAVNAGLDDFLSIPLLGDGDHDQDDKQQRSAKKTRSGNCEDDAWFDLAAGDGRVISQKPWSNGGTPEQQPHVPLLPEFLTEFVLPLPPPPPPPPQMSPAFVRGADAKKHAAGNGCQQSVQSAAARERRKRISEKTAELSRLIPGGHKLNTADMFHEAARHVKLLQAQVGMLALLHTIEGKIPSMAQEEMHRLLVCGGVQERLAGEGKCLVPMELVAAIANDAAVKSNELVNRDLSRFVESLPPEQH